MRKRRKKLERMEVSIANLRGPNKGCVYVIHSVLRQEDKGCITKDAVLALQEQVAVA